jgi:hypothetical protein
MSQRPTTLGKAWGGLFGNGEHAEETVVHPLPLKSSSATATTTTGGDSAAASGVVVVESEKEKSPTAEHTHGLTSPLAAGATLVRKMQSLLVGSTTGGAGGNDSRRLSPNKRASVLPGLAAMSPRPSADVKPPPPEEEEKDKDAAEAAGEGESADASAETTPRPSSPSKGTVPPVVNVHRRAATILDSHGRTTRHERRSSTGGVLLTAGGSIGRHRRPSMGFAGRAERLFARDNDLAEKREEEEAAEEPSADVPAHDVGDHEESFKDESAKPVYLKGLFR